MLSPLVQESVADNNWEIHRSFTWNIAQTEEGAQQGVMQTGKTLHNSTNTKTLV